MPPLLQVSHKYLAEAQLQREGMASQLRGQQQQQQQRREGEPAPEQFRAAYSQLVFKCQELERQLDSALDQLDVSEGYCPGTPDTFEVYYLPLSCRVYHNRRKYWSRSCTIIAYLYPMKSQRSGL